MLRGECALITGSTSGLGLAIADRLAAEGCNIVLNGLAGDSEEKNLREDLERRRSVSVVYHGANLGDPAQIAEMMQFAAVTFGRVDLLVNNAVVRHFAPIEDFPVERWNEALAVNLSAAFHTIRLALPAMRQQGWGRIINVASVYSFFATPNCIGYVTTKTALLGLTRTVALEIAGWHRHHLQCRVSRHAAHNRDRVPASNGSPWNTTFLWNRRGASISPRGSPAAAISR